MKIRTQFMISTLVLGSFLLLVSASEIITNQLIRKINQQEDFTAQIEREAYELGYLANDYLLYRESQQANRWESKFVSFSENLSNLDASTPEQQALLANLKMNQQRLKSVFEEIRASIESAPQTQDVLLDTKFMQVSWSRLEVQNQGLIFDASRLEGLLREQEDRLRRVTSLFSFVLIAGLGGFLLGSYGMTFRRTLKSIAELQAGTRIIGSGNLDFAIAVKGEDEIGELSRAFNQMTANLKEVTASKAALEREITERKHAEEMLRNTNEKLRDQADELTAQSEELRLQTDELAIVNTQLRESEERYSVIFDKSPFGIVLSRLPEGITMSVNDAFLNFYDFNRKEVIGKTSVELGIMDPESGAQVAAQMRSRGSVEDYEVTHTTMTGARRILSLNLDPVSIDEKDHLLTTIRDVTERRQMDQALRQSEARFRLALTHAPVSVAAQDCDLVYTWAYNQKTRRPDEIIGKTDFDLFPAEAAHLTDLKRRVLETGENISEQLWITSNEQRLFLDLFIEPLRNETGEIEGVGLATVDLTQVKLAEQRIAAHTSEIQAANKELNTARLAALNLIEDTMRAQEELQKVNAMLRESEQHLNRAQEIAHLGSWELDLVINQLSWSDEVYRIFGLEPQEFGATYEAFLEAVHPEDRAAVDESYSSSIREGMDTYEIEHRVVNRSSGEIRFVHEKCEHFRNESGQIIRSVGMVHDVTERKQAERALRASEEKYRNLFENMTEEVHFWQLVRDESGQIQTWRLVDANPPTLKTWGSDSIQDVRGKTTDEIFGPGATDHYMPVVQRIITEGLPHSYEDYFPHLDKHFRFTSVPLGDYFITTGADITNLKKAEEVLRRSHDQLELLVQERTKELEVANLELKYEIYEREEAERQLRIQTTAMEAAANGILITDPDGEILWANPAITLMTGYTLDNLLGQNIRVFKSGQHGPDYYRKMWDRILAGEVWQGETTNRRKDGILYIEEQTITPVKSEDGKISHFIAIKQDVSEQKQIAAALELERTRLKNILDTIPDGVYIVNQDYEIEYLNPVIEKEFGPIGNQKCYAYFHDLAEPCSWCMSERVFPGLPNSGEHTYAKNNKSYEVFDAPLANADGSVSKLKLLHDITQRKKMEQDLEQSNLELKSANISEQKQRQAAETLRAATQALARSLDLDTVLNTLLKHVTALVDTDIASIGFVEDETRLVARIAQVPEKRGKLNHAPVFPIDAKTDFFFQKVAASRKSQIIRDATRDPDWIDYPGLEPIRSWMGIPIMIDDKVIGVVLLGKTQRGFFTREHARSAEVLVGQAAVAIQNAWLFEQVRAGRERLQLLSRRLVEIQESERRYIARELHDQAGQSLTSLMLGLGQLEKGSAIEADTQAQTRKLKLLAGDILENLHRLAVDLRPASLDHLGLVPAVEQLVKSFHEHEELEVKFKAVGLGETTRLSTEIETTLYRIVQEALTNVARHAKATRADVILELRGNSLLLIVEDNGIGFDATLSPDNEHLGLIGIRERTEMLGGILTVESIIGSGTTLVVEVPNANTNLAGG